MSWKWRPRMSGMGATFGQFEAEDSFRRLPQKGELVLKISQAPNDFSILEPGESSHYGTLISMVRQGVAVFNARLCNLSCQPLCYLRDFSDAATLCNQAWNVRARGEKPSFIQRLDTESYC